MTNSIPYCLYPTTISVIDDNQAFSKSICLNLSSMANTIPFISPKSALEYLSVHTNASFLENCLLQNTDSLKSKPKVIVEITKIYKEAYRIERFKQISVVIVDYTMPGMNGVELCRHLKDKNFKKIMLTGEADHNIAVQAFNEGIIDQFIMKGSGDMITTLEKAVIDMQKQYFLELSKIVTNTLINSGSNPPSHLLDPDFAQFFNSFIKEHKISEYYLASNEGDYLLINNKNQQSWLVIRDEKAMKALAKLALNEHKQEPTEESEEIVTAIQSKKQIPFFAPETDDVPEIFDWQSRMHEAHALKGNHNTFYYAHVLATEKFEEIVTFAQLN